MPQVEQAEYQQVSLKDKSIFSLNNAISVGTQFNDYLLHLFIPQSIYNRKLKEDLTQFLLGAKLCNDFSIPPQVDLKDTESYLVQDDKANSKVKVTLSLKGLNLDQVNKLIQKLHDFLNESNIDSKHFETMEILRNEGTVIGGENPFKFACSLIQGGFLPANHPFKTIQCKPPSIATTSAPIPIPQSSSSKIYDSKVPQSGTHLAAQIAYSPSHVSDLPRQTVQMEKPPSLVEPTTIDERTEHNLGELERLLKELPRSEVEKVLLRAGFGTRPRAGSTGGLSALFGNRASQSTPPPIESPATPGMNPVVLPPSNGSVVLAVQYEQAQQPLAATSLSRR